jgi:plastocyanin
MRVPFVLPVFGALLFAAAPQVAAKGGKSEKAAEAKGGKVEKPAETKPAQAEAKPAQAEAKPAQVIEISVTKEGFVPKEVKVKVGQPVKLLVTRKIDRTCAKDIVIKDYNINEALPLDKTVTVAFTPSKAGTTRFACAMDMIAGVIVAE